MWISERKKAKTQLKMKFLEAPVLKQSNVRDRYTSAIDALLKGQRKYSTTNRKLYVIVHFTQRLKW